MNKSNFGLRCLIINVALCICFFVFISLYHTAKWHSTLSTVLWAFALTIATITLPLASTEWMKTRYSHILAPLERRSYGPDTSPSRLLLLPPEIRLQVWEELVPRARCARGDIRINIDLDAGGPWQRRAGIEGSSRRVLRRTPRNQKGVYPGIPTAFLRTCRRNYDERCYFYYSTSIFYFDDPLTLYEVVNTLSPSLRGFIRHVRFSISSVWLSWYVSSRPLGTTSPSDDWRSYGILRASRVPSLIATLRDLRTVEIDALVPEDGRSPRKYSRRLYEFLREVKASEMVTVKLHLRNGVKGSRVHRTMSTEWRCHSQEQFATAAGNLVLDPYSRVELAARNEGVAQTEYVLMMMFSE